VRNDKENTAKQTRESERKKDYFQSCTSEVWAISTRDAFQSTFAHSSSLHYLRGQLILGAFFLPLDQEKNFLFSFCFKIMLEKCPWFIKSLVILLKISDLSHCKCLFSVWYFYKIRANKNSQVNIYLYFFRGFRIALWTVLFTLW
jgi:hypothetical protein